MIHTLRIYIYKINKIDKLFKSIDFKEKIEKTKKKTNTYEKDICI